MQELEQTTIKEIPFRLHNNFEVTKDILFDSVSDIENQEVYKYITQTIYGTFYDQKDIILSYQRIHDILKYVQEFIQYIPPNLRTIKEEKSKIYFSPEIILLFLSAFNVLGLTHHLKLKEGEQPYLILFCPTNVYDNELSYDYKFFVFQSPNNKSLKGKIDKIIKCNIIYEFKDINESLQNYQDVKGFLEKATTENLENTSEPQHIIPIVNITQKNYSQLQIVSSLTSFLCKSDHFVEHYVCQKANEVSFPDIQHTKDSLARYLGKSINEMN